jgi:hypothetical protein
VDELVRLMRLVRKTDAEVTMSRAAKTSAIDGVPPGSWAVRIDVPEWGTSIGCDGDLLAAIGEALAKVHE